MARTSAITPDRPNSAGIKRLGPGAKHRPAAAENALTAFRDRRLSFELEHPVGGGDKQ